MNPFLPWPGSKAKCSADIIDEFPTEIGTYFEPFLGSGAIFFGMGNYNSLRRFKRARLSDTSVNLINCWKAVMERPEQVAKILAHCLERNNGDFYNEMRKQTTSPSVFLYVMIAASSSMARENLKGVLDTIGKRIRYDLDQIGLCSRYMAAKNVELAVASWIDAIHDVKRGDLVYFDPPYLPFTESGFVNYVAGGFGEGEHVFLRTQCRLLSEKGAFVALSNSDVPASRRIYGEPTKLISVTNAVKSTATNKGKRSEGLWIWEPR